MWRYLCRNLTYRDGNISVGRVIGVHRGRVMGRQDSVVVDSECCDGEKRGRNKKHTQQKKTREQNTSDFQYKNMCT